MTIPASLSLHFQGEISVPAGREFTTAYIQVPFEVPAGMREICLRLNYSPAGAGGIKNLITLGLFDPLGFRGNAHRNPPDERVCLAADGATDGFIPGPLPAGAWLAQLAVHLVLAEERAFPYTLDIELYPGRDAVAGPARWRPQERVLRDQPDWYRGELHSHTVHSDANLSAEELISLSRTRGLDFLFITDHNTHSVYYELAGRDLQGLLLIPGMELTTFEGHALVLGIKDWVDWRVGYAGRKMEDAARETQQAGGLFIVAHPYAIGSPHCTGCRWENGDFKLSSASGIEVWNGRWRIEGREAEKNPDGLRLWHELQKKGLNLTATAGTDIHSARDWEQGAPMVYVKARSLSAEAVLEGLRAGRVILSSGPWIDLHIRAGAEGPASGVGETCLGAGQDFNLSAEWNSAPAKARLVIRSSQGVLETAEVSGVGAKSRRLTVADEERFWLELYSAEGDLLALTNPVRAQVALAAPG